jgi:hypothetical protein
MKPKRPDPGLVLQGEHGELLQRLNAMPLDKLFKRCGCGNRILICHAKCSACSTGERRERLRLVISELHGRASTRSDIWLLRELGHPDPEGLLRCISERTRKSATRASL